MQLYIKSSFVNRNRRNFTGTTVQHIILWVAQMIAAVCTKALTGSKQQNAPRWSGHGTLGGRMHPVNLSFWLDWFHLEQPFSVQMMHEGKTNRFYLLLYSEDKMTGPLLRYLITLCVYRLIVLDGCKLRELCLLSSSLHTLEVSI